MSGVLEGLQADARRAGATFVRSPAIVPADGLARLTSRQENLNPWTIERGAQIEGIAGRVAPPACPHDPSRSWYRDPSMLQETSITSDPTTPEWLDPHAL
jgi:hypothetical protein